MPRSALARWKAPADRVDPVEQIKHSHAGRLDWLIPIRVGRMVGLAVRIPARHRRRHGRGRRAAARHRHHAGDLRRRPPGQLRLLRLAGARPRHRPQRLRRGAPRCLGVGPAPAGRQHLGGRAAERRRAKRSAQAAVASCVAAYRAEVRFLADQPLLSALLRAARRRPAARDGDREVAARRDRAGRQARAIADQRPRAAAVHRRSATGGGTSSRSRR